MPFRHHRLENKVLVELVWLWDIRVIKIPNYWIDWCWLKGVWDADGQYGWLFFLSLEGARFWIVDEGFSAGSSLWGYGCSIARRFFAWPSGQAFSQRDGKRLAYSFLFTQMALCRHWVNVINCNAFNRSRQWLAVVFLVQCRPFARPSWVLIAPKKDT